LPAKQDEFPQTNKTITKKRENGSDPNVLWNFHSSLGYSPVPTKCLHAGKSHGGGGVEIPGSISSGFRPYVEIQGKLKLKAHTLCKWTDTDG
jgi:hypothetical protein